MTHVQHTSSIALARRLASSAAGPASAALVLALVLVGCGAPAAPQPPTLNLPQPVADLAATRAGNVVHLTFAVPQKTTDKLPVLGPITARLCRSVEGGNCTSVRTVEVKPMQAAAVDDLLPPELTSGAPRLLTYQVALENRAGKSAPVTSPAYAIAGPAPAAIDGFTATPRRQGIVLHWQPGEDAAEVRIDRLRTSAAPAPPPARPDALPAGDEPEEPAEQALRIAQPGSTRGAALDATAHTGRSYRYTAQRIAQITLAGHQLQVASAPSAPVLVDYRDIFPPMPPTGLVSAVDTPAGAIDLSWTPEADPHIGGYAVYRRALPAPGAATTTAADPRQRLTPAGKPVGVTAWRDTTAVRGQRYAYSVTAVDPSGNESAPSAEVEDTLPALDPQP